MQKYCLVLFCSFKTEAHVQMVLVNPCYRFKKTISILDDYNIIIIIIMIHYDYIINSRASDKATKNKRKFDQVEVDGCPHTPPQDHLMATMSG